MNLIERVKNIIISPKTEWDVIKGETPNTAAIFTGYVLPLAGAAAAAAFIGYGLIGVNLGFGLRIKGFDWGMYQAITVLAGAFLSVFISAFVIDMLAPSFESEKNMGRSIQLVAYSWTPGWVGGLLAIIPALSIIGGLAGLYGLYLLYEGLPKLKNTSEDKKVAYYVVSLITIILVFVVVGLLLREILTPAFGITHLSRGRWGI